MRVDNEDSRSGPPRLPADPMLSPTDDNCLQIDTFIMISMIVLTTDYFQRLVVPFRLTTCASMVINKPMKSARPKRGRKRHVQVELFRRGGKRRGAGRKPKGSRAGIRHEARPDFKAYQPLHVVMR